MNELLQSSGKAICSLLEAWLPKLGGDWWKDCVIQRLTFQQQRSVEDRRIATLAALDFAALLRVLDQNWHEIAAVHRLPREARTWLKELQGVRNRWAHAPSDGLTATDAYRDADTLARLLEAIGAPSDLVARVDVFRKDQLARLAPNEAPASSEPVPSAVASDQATATPTPEKEHKFNVGDLVSLRSNPSVVLPVLAVLPSLAGETRYRVFEASRRQDYYESQLKAIEPQAAERATVSPADLSAFMTGVQLSASSSSSLHSFNVGRIRYVPYQYRPVFKLIRADRPRLLVADEVGVGKTIEAGLILKELQARNDVKSVLIICPKALVAERKWELEMRRFDEQFTPLDGSLLRHCIRETHLGGEWPLQYEKAILPFSLFDSDLLFGKPSKVAARDVGLLALDPPPKFDLVIVDEAHHIRNTDTFLHQAVRYFCDHAEAVIFLSATPVQLGRDDLFTLLNVLRPDVVIDPPSFDQMAEPNPHINEAVQACRRGAPEWAEQVREALRTVAATEWGRNVLAVNPGFQHIYDAVADGTTDAAARIRTIQALEDLYTFSSLINRTRRRDIGEFTTRKPETISRDFTPSQRALHDDLLALIATVLARLHGNQNVRFMMSTVSRQAASCLYGLAPALEDMLLGKLDQLEASEASDADAPEGSYEFVGQIAEEIRSLIDRAKRLDSNDPKADAFMQVVTEKLAMNKNKVLVFSTFRHTLAYLVRKLEMARVRFGLVHGGIPDDVRAALRHRFGLPKGDENAIDVLLSSEVGCEGLDFQFCDCLVNYDLPWNPMRIEQRIGRIDRYGQESETVAIANFITPGTIDADIYDRCLSRIGVFHHAIGGSEEILGEITRELHSISDAFTLSDDERADRLKQLADNKIRQIEEEQKLEERQGELFGLNLAAASWEEKLRRSRNHWLEPEALALAVSAYLSRRLGKEQDYLLGDREIRTLRLSQQARALLLEDFRRIPKSADPMHRTWERWLKGASPTLQVTFEQEAAVDAPSATLLSLRHPLVRQAAALLNGNEAVYVKVKASHAAIAPGAYPFAVYRWERQGARLTDELVGVASEPAVSEHVLELLQSAESADAADLPDQGAFDDLDAVHHQRWLAATAEHAEDNRQLAQVRIQSLAASHGARRRLLESQLERATNDKIRLMKAAELERAEADFAQRTMQLKLVAESGDIKTAPVVFGLLVIEGAT